MKIVIFTQSPISKAPRVVKEANCLVRNGFEVTVFSLWYETKIIQKDFELLDSRITYQPGIDISIQNVKSAFCRMKRRVFRELVCFFGIQSKHALGYGYNQYLKKLYAAKANLYIGHEEMSLALAKHLILQGFNVAFDFEDFHSQDLLPKDRKYRPIKLLSYLEGFVLNNSVFCTTTSDSLANELSCKYKSKTPETIYNSFHSCNINKMSGHLRNSNTLVWISQVIGPGRGLELFLNAITLSNLYFELTLIGKKDIDFCELITRTSPKNLKLVFSDYILPNQIASELAKFDLGLAFEEINPKSRDLTITNKVFHYLNSGIAILATNTSGQLEIKEKTNGAIALVNFNPREIAKRLDQIFSDKGKLDFMKSQSKYFGNEVFCFENEENKILRLVNDSRT